MTGRIDEIELVADAVFGLILQGNALGFDGNAPLPLQIHGITNLVSHLPVAQTTTGLDEPIGYGGFTMIDMGNNGKVADMLKISHKALNCH